MKHQQVVVDYWSMLKTSVTYLMLAISGYVLMKMVQTIFFLPRYLKHNQKRLEELAAKYNLDLEKEIAEAELEVDTVDLSGKSEEEQNLLKINNNVELVKEPKKFK